MHGHRGRRTHLADSRVPDIVCRSIFRAASAATPRARPPPLMPLRVQRASPGTPRPAAGLFAIKRANSRAAGNNGRAHRRTATTIIPAALLSLSPSRSAALDFKAPRGRGARPTHFFSSPFFLLFFLLFVFLLLRRYEPLPCPPSCSSFVPAVALLLPPMRAAD